MLTSLPTQVDSTPFSKQVCEQLFQAVLVHDDVYLDARLPAEIYLDYSPRQLAACYAISRQTWYRDDQLEVIAEIVEEMQRHRDLSKSAQREFKYIRARFKHLRFACYSYGRQHRYPLLFNIMIKLMGSLQDALRNQHEQMLKQFIWLFKLFLTPAVYRQICREVEGFNVCSTDSFKAYVFKEMDFLQHYLMRKRISSKEFHEMRKVISRLVAHYDNLKILYPSDYHEQMSKFLSTINGMMGSAHDDLVMIKLKEKKAYYNGAFEMDKPIRWRLEALVNACDRLREQD